MLTLSKKVLRIFWMGLFKNNLKQPWGILTQPAFTYSNLGVVLLSLLLTLNIFHTLF